MWRGYEGRGIVDSRDYTQSKKEQKIYIKKSKLDFIKSTLYNKDLQRQTEEMRDMVI
jgi:hypothetical protein